MEMMCFIELLFKFIVIIFMIYLIIKLHQENKMLNKAMKRNLDKEKGK
jgi:hypothetical protein